jgi:hypothetical protein
MIDQDGGPADTANGDDPTPETVAPPQTENSALHKQESHGQQAQSAPEPSIGEDAIVRYTAKLATWTRWLAILTGVLAFATIGLWIVAYFQWEELHSTDEHIADQLLIMRAGQRAWITIDNPVIDSPLKFDDDNATIWIKMTLKNTGYSPALSVVPYLHLYPYPVVVSDVPRPPFCKGDNTYGGWQNAGNFVFPNETKRDSAWAANTARGGEKGTPFPKNSALGFIISGCIRYESAGDPVQHFTGFSFGLSPDLGTSQVTFDWSRGKYDPSELALWLIPIGSYAN